MGGGASKGTSAAQGDEAGEEDTYHDEEHYEDDEHGEQHYEDEQRYYDSQDAETAHGAIQPWDGESAAAAEDESGAAPVPPLALPTAPRGWTSGEAEAMAAKRRLARLRAVFIGRRGAVNALKTHALAVTGPNPFVLTGDQGCGKSAAVATFLAEFENEAKKQGSGNATAAARKTLPDMSDLRDQSIVKAIGEGSQVVPGGEGNNPPFVLYHSFSEVAPGGCARLRRVIIRMCQSLKARFGIYHPVPGSVKSATKDDDEVSVAFARFLAHASLFTRIVVVFDDLDRADTSGMPADWLPISLPLAVRVFIVSNGTRWLKSYCERRANNITVHKMEATELEERKGFMLKTLGHVLTRVDAAGASGKRSTEFLRALYPLMEKAEAGRPLYLVTALNEVERRYRRIEEDANEGEVAAEALQGLVEDIVAFPDTTRGLFLEVLGALEHEYGQTLIGDTITLLACARSGLQVSELCELLRENDDQSDIEESYVVRLLDDLEPYLIQGTPMVNTPIDDTIRVFNSSPLFTIAVKRYLPSWQDVRRVHQRLGGFFERSTAERDGGHSWRTALEYFHQLVKGEDFQAMSVHCANPEVLSAYATDTDFREDLKDALDLIASSKADLSQSTSLSGNTSKGDAGKQRVREIIKQAEEAADMKARADAKDVSMLSNGASFMSWYGIPAAAEDLLAKAVERAVESRGVGSDANAERTDRMLGTLLTSLGDVAAKQGRYDEAEETFNQAIALYSKLYGTESNPFVAAATLSCADAKYATENAKEAFDLYVKAVQLWESSEEAGYEGEDPTSIVRALCGLSSACEDLNQCVEAEHANEKALEKLEQTLGADHPEVSEHLSTMAMSYKSHGEFMKAEFCFCRTLTFDHRFYSSRSLPVARTYSNLADLHRLMGDNKHTLALYQRALQICEDVKGNHDTEAATYLNNAAEILRSQGNFAEAEPLYMRALAIDKEALGQASPTLSIRLNNLAELYRDQGRYDEAKPLYEKAISIDEAALGRSSPTLATYLNNLAGCHKMANELEEAEAAYKRAIALDESALGAQHPDIAIYLSNLAGIYKLQKRFEEAEPIYKRALAITEEALGENHSDAAVFYSNLAMLKKEQGELEQARPYYEKAIDIGEVTLGADHPQVAKRLSNLGSLLFEMKYFAEAKRLFSRANTICTKALGANHPDTMACRGWCDAIDSYMRKMASDKEREERAAAANNDRMRKGKEKVLNEPALPSTSHPTASNQAFDNMKRRNSMSMEAMLQDLGEIDEDAQSLRSHNSSPTKNRMAFASTSETAAVEETPGAAEDYDHLPVAPRPAYARNSMVSIDATNVASAIASDPRVTMGDSEDLLVSHSNEIDMMEQQQQQVEKMPQSQVKFRRVPSEEIPSMQESTSAEAMMHESVSANHDMAHTQLQSQSQQQVSTAQAINQSMNAHDHHMPQVQANGAIYPAPTTEPMVPSAATGARAINAAPNSVPVPVTSLLPAVSSSIAPNSGLHAQAETMAAQASMVSLNSSLGASNVLQGSPTRMHPTTTNIQPVDAASMLASHNLDSSVATMQQQMALAQQMQMQQAAQQMQMQLMELQKQVLELKMSGGSVKPTDSLDAAAEAEIASASVLMNMENVPPVGYHADLSAMDLDSFLAAKVEYLGNRRYRCLLDGKVLSTFNLMRVHVAKSFPGEIREFAAEQRRARESAASGMPMKTSPELQSAGNAEPIGASKAMPDGSKFVAEAQRSAPTPIADDRMEKLERELGRLQGAVSAQLGVGTATTPDAIGVTQQKIGPAAGASATMPVPGQNGAALPSEAEARIAALEAELRRMQSSAPPPHMMTPSPYVAAVPGMPWSAGAVMAPMSYLAERQAMFGRNSALEEQYIQAMQHRPSAVNAWATPNPTSASAAARAPSSLGMPLSATPEHAEAAAPAVASSGQSFSDMLEAERGENPFRSNGAMALQQDAARAPLGGGSGISGESAGVKEHMVVLAKQSRLTQPVGSSHVAGDPTHPLQALVSKGDMDRIGLFMCARSEQIGRRQFLCELDGHTFSTIHLLRAHFEKNYQREAEEWWNAQQYL